MQFDGQQSDEKVLTIISPHITRFIFSLATVIIVFLFIMVIIFSIASFIPLVATPIRTIATLISLSVLAIAIWWLWKTQTNDKTYITDRRIIRFDVVTPFFTNKRALFWNEVLKVKAYANNMMLRLMKIGILQIEPVAAEQESVIIPDVYYHEDLANYIDKIIFAFKNKPEEINSMKPFVPLPKGKRD
ncbi:MAG: hypothetical protein ACD_48C00152G0005 [uncultured bacterium]|nr:MAG: hypothetical protein ACD_48C00152G0005 [uncultured bacterium]